MVSKNQILLVLEEGTWREESARYGLELAKRLRASLQILMLYRDRPPREPDTDNAIVRSLYQVALEEKVRITTTVRHGNKASELLKHMIEHRPIHTLVWGGDVEALSGTKSQRTKHWFSRIRNEVDCPVVTAAKKAIAT